MQAHVASCLLFFFFSLALPFSKALPWIISWPLYSSFRYASFNWVNPLVVIAYRSKEILKDKRMLLNLILCTFVHIRMLHAGAATLINGSIPLFWSLICGLTARILSPNLGYLLGPMITLMSNNFAFTNLNFRLWTGSFSLLLLTGR